MSGSEDTASYKLDPNYAVICSFLEHFAELFYDGSVPLSIQTLDSFLEADSVKTDNEIVKFHRKLLNGIGNTTKLEQWEKGLIKFSEDFPERDDKLIRKSSYNKIPVAAKLRILRNLCEDQFEYNDRFNVKVNKLEETDIRNVSLGTDRQGRTYWYIMDKKGSIRVYRSFRDDFTCQETWRLLCSDADGLKDLIEFLETYGDIEVDPQLPKDRAIPPSKLLFKKKFLEITEDDVEDIVADTKNPNQMYYKLPKARTSVQIDRDEKKNKLKHCFIKLSAEDKTPADVSLEKLREEIKLEKLAGNTENPGSTEISNEIEEASEAEDVGETDVGETEDKGEMKDDVKSLKLVKMENEKPDKESKTEKADRTFNTGKTGETSETEDTSEIEEVNEMRDGEKREEESDMEEADNTETADEAEEEYKTDQIGITEKAGKIQDASETEDASEMEEVSEIRDTEKREEESDVEEADNTETADDAEEEYKTEQIGITEKAGKIQDASETEDASEMEGVRDTENREEESDMEEADNTEMADETEEEFITKKIGKSEKAGKTEDSSETEQASETGEAIKIEKAGIIEKAVIAKEAIDMEKIGKVCEKEEIGVLIENQEKRCKGSKSTDAICHNNLEIGNSQVFQKDELCIKGKDTDLTFHRKEKQGMENKTETDNSDTKEDKTVSACEEVKQKEVVNLQEKKEECGSVESVKDNTQSAISIGTKYEQDVLVSNNAEDQDVKDKSCSLNGESSIEANQDGIKSSDVTLDAFEDDKDMKETLMRISELSGAYIGSKSRPDIGKEDTQSTENNANDLLQVSDESNTIMTNSLSIEKGESDKISAIEQHSKEKDTKAFDEALEGLKTLEEIISQGNAILASGESMENKLEKDERLDDKLSELKSATSSMESSKDTSYQDDMIDKDKHEIREQTSKTGERTLICDKINDSQSGKEAEASDSVSKSLDHMIKSLKSCSNTSVEPEIPTEIKFGHKEFDLNKSKISEQVLDEKQYSNVKLETQQDALKKELKVELERIDEIFKRKKQDMNDLVKVFNCDRFDVKPRNSSVKGIPVCSVKEEKNSHTLERYTKSESMKSRSGLRSQMVIDKKPGMEFYSYIVKDENNVEIVQPTKDGKNRNEDKKYKDASNLKRDTDQCFGFESLLDDKLEGVKVDQTSAVYKINGHKSPVHELRNETVTENKGKSPEVKIVKTVSSDNRIVNKRNKAESSVGKSKEESSEKTVKMMVDGDIIEINELSSSSETEEQGDDMDADKTVQVKRSCVKTATQAIENSDIKSNLELAYSSLDRSKRLAKEALKVNRERMSMGNKILHDKPKTMDKLPLVTPRVPLKPTKLVSLSATAASQKIILTSNPTSDNLLPLTSIVPVSTAAPKSTVVIVPQSNVQLLQKSGVSFVPQSNVKIVPQSNVKIVPQSNVKIVPQSNIRIVPQSSVQRQSSIVPQSSVLLQSSVKKPAPPAPVCRSLLQNSNKSSSPTSPAVSSKFVTISPSNSSMKLPVSTSSGLSPSGQYLNKVHNTANPASREGNFSEKQTGSQVLHPDMGRKIIVGPGMKCYDAETGLDVNLKLTGNAFPFLRPGSTFYLVKKLTSNETFQNKEQHGVPQTVSNLNQNALGKNTRIRWREPRTSKVKRGRRSARGRGRGRATEILDDSSDSEEFVPMDSDDSDYDYDSLSRHIHEVAKKERKFEMRLPRFLQEGYETDMESSKRETRQKEAINYNEDIVEISDSDVDVETVQEKVEENAKPKPPEKFELMEYPCTICGSSDFFATILTCADCDSTYHMACLTPPLLALPSEDWFCPQCEHEMLVENLKEKYKQLRKLLYSIERKNNKINLKMFGINKENIITVDRSARTRKEVNYDETKFDDMVKSAVREYNKTEEQTSEEKKSSVMDSDESDCLSATETEPTDNSVGEQEENRRSKEASSEPDSYLRSSRKRSAKNQKSAGCEDTGPTERKVKKIANGGKVDVKLVGKSVNKAGDKQRQTRSSRQGKEMSEESDDSQKRKLGRTARNSTDADSDFALSDSDVICLDGDSDTEDYEDNTVKKEEPEEHVYYTSSGRKTNSLSKLKNAF